MLPTSTRSNDCKGIISMPIYPKVQSRIYRKIYEEHFGPIPQDENGIPYDIHHCDGNRENNHPSNLMALSIKDHYALHYEQGDYGACAALSSRMKLTREEKSQLVKLQNKKAILEGTHNFLGGKMQKETQMKRVAEGKHPWSTGESQKITTNRRLREGTHPFQFKWTCPICGISGKNKAMYNRWHNFNCRMNKK